MKMLARLAAASALLCAGAAFCLVDINSASQKELEGLTGIGPVMAQRIIEGRPYRSVSDLRRVKGIGPKTLDKFKNEVTVGAPGGSAKAPREEAPPKEEPERTQVRVYAAPPFTLVECHSCTNRFTVSSELGSGWCPYCDTRWRLKTPPAPAAREAAAAPKPYAAPGVVADAIPFSDAADYVDQRKSVAGTIVGAHRSARSGNLYLNFHSEYSKYLSVKIPAAELPRFRRDAESYYTGKEVVATGEITREGNANYLRLTVTDPADFKVIE
jgi:competence protein ComEA